MKISKKLYIAFAAIIVILLLLSMVTYINLAQYSQADSWNIHTYKVISDFQNLSQSMINMETGQRGYSITGDDKFLEPYNSGKSDFDKYYNEIKELTSDNPKEQEQLQKIKSEKGNWLKAADESISLRKESLSNATSINNVIEFEKEAHGKTSMDSIRGLINASIDMEQNLLNQRNQTSNGLKNNLYGFLLIGTLLAIIMTVPISISIARSISKPVTEIESAAKELANGNLNIELHMVESNNEIGQLGKSFIETIVSLKSYIDDLSLNLSKIAEGDLCIESTIEYKGNFEKIKSAMISIDNSINTAMVNIDQAAQQVASGSEQVSNGSQALAQGATEQASSIEELAAVINDIYTNVKDNASYAADASKEVNQVSNELEQSNLQMKNMISAMERINNSSNEISKIIKSIEDIAFQTNILALNAAVEAARAGEAGKGFAVVADEVRSLASKSSDAAKNTAELIQNSINEVESGTKLANTTAASVLQVVEHAENVAKKVDQISLASDQQSRSLSQVKQGIEQISNIVQTNSATAEESAAASEELSSQAVTMRALVEKFKLKEVSNV